MNRMDAGLYGLGAFSLVLAMALTMSGHRDAAIFLYTMAGFIGGMYTLDLVQHLRTTRHRTTTGRTER